MHRTQQLRLRQQLRLQLRRQRKKATEKTATDKKQESAPIHYTEGMKVELDADGTWKGDPGDGTDFILVVDIPIEDQAAIPTVDIFDRPTTPQTSHQYTPSAATSRTSRKHQPTISAIS